MAADSPQARLRREVEALKRYTGQLEEQIQEIKNQPTGLDGMLASMGFNTAKRRQIVKLVGAGFALPAAITYAASGSADADAVAADVGTQADPWRTGFFAALNAGDGQQLTDWETGFNAHAATKSAAYSTSGEHFIDVDTSVSGVTITLATADTVLGHYIVLRQNGSNDLTIGTEGSENIDGSGTLTLQHDGAMIILWSDGSNWFSNQFIDTVDAGTIATDDLTINNFGAKGRQTSTQDVPNNTTTTIAIDSAAFEDDSTLIEVDEANDKLIIKQSGIYLISANIKYSESLADGTAFHVWFTVGGTIHAENRGVAGGSVTGSKGASALVEVTSPNKDVIGKTFQDSGSARLTSGDQKTHLSVGKLA